MRILLVDDEPTMVRVVAAFIRKLGHEVREAGSAAQALTCCAAQTFHVVLTDIHMPGMDGIELLTALKQPQDEAMAVIVFTGHSDEALAIRALRAGAFDYLKKPLNIEELAIALERAEEHLTLRAENRVLTSRFSEAVEGRTAPLGVQLRQMEQALYTERGLDRVHLFSDVMRQVFAQALVFSARREVPVLIEGESGTGKELVAHWVHLGDSSTPGPFVALNGAAMSAELFQSELFGYEGGAFTGANPRGSPGKLDLAQGGTLFLDEVGEMPLELQARLLRVLETRQYYRVGGLKTLRTDARFVFATNHILATEVAQGRFRRDLYHRLNVGHLFIPPLRERRAEIVPLAEAFLAEFCQRYGKHFQGFTPEAQQFLHGQLWEGNVRELRNTVERAVILAQNTRLTVADLDGVARLASAPLSRLDGELPPDRFDLEQHELAIVRKALAKHGGNKTRTATYLGISLKVLRSRLERILCKDGEKSPPA